MIDLSLIDQRITQANQIYPCSNCRKDIVPLSYCFRIGKYSRICLNCIPKFINEVENEQKLYIKHIQLLKGKYTSQLNKMQSQNIIAKLKWEQQKY